jgi:hypothetical protein
VEGLEAAAARVPPFVKQDLNTEDFETNVIVLVHGRGFGAWGWYKTMSLLEDSGFKVNAMMLMYPLMFLLDQICAT